MPISQQIIDETLIKAKKKVVLLATEIALKATRGENNNCEILAAKQLLAGIKALEDENDLTSTEKKQMINCLIKAGSLNFLSLSTFNAPSYPIILNQATYLSLLDTTDADYTGKFGYVPVVNATEDGLTLMQIGYQDVIIANTVFFSKNGNDSIGIREYLTKPFLTPEAARAAAAPGDIIIGFAGTYNAKNIIKDGVDLKLLGATIHYTGSQDGALIDDSPTGSNSPLRCKISGHGSLKRYGTGNNDSFKTTVYLENSLSEVIIDLIGDIEGGLTTLYISNGKLKIRANKVFSEADVPFYTINNGIILPEVKEAESYSNVVFSESGLIQGKIDKITGHHITVPALRFGGGAIDLISDEINNTLAGVTIGGELTGKCTIRKAVLKGTGQGRIIDNRNSSRLILIDCYCPGNANISVFLTDTSMLESYNSVFEHPLSSGIDTVVMELTGASKGILSNSTVRNYYNGLNSYPIRLFTSTASLVINSGCKLLNAATTINSIYALLPATVYKLQADLVVTKQPNANLSDMIGLFQIKESVLFE